MNNINQPPRGPDINTDPDLLARVAADPHRPRYHFLPPANWLNDPNGLIQFRGAYHMFYQYNPHGAFHGTMHWGHASSTDLVHWTHLPIALAPTPGGPDSGGCWSGCAVDDDGVPTLIYSGHVADTPGGFQLPCLATSTDDLLTFTKHGTALMESPPPELDLIAFRDHSVWKEGDTWYQAIGSGIRGSGGAVLLFRSQNLRNWEYLHPLATGEETRTEPLWTGSMWECPDFFPLADRHVLIISAWHERKTFHSVWMIGDYAGHRFTPEREGYVDLGRSFYAPQSMFDEHGRRIMWGWLREERKLAAQMTAGWSGVMSLPRILSIAPNGDLGMEPAPELQMLRGAHVTRSGIALADGSSSALPELRGATLEIIAEWQRGDASAVGLDVRCSPDGEEMTRIVYDWTQQQLRIERNRSSLDDDAGKGDVGGTLALDDDEPLRLHIFLDGSVVEIFANGRACLSARIYPTRADSLRVHAFARGSATLARLDAWEMAAIWTGDERIPPSPA